MDILVLGGTRFVGRAVVERLLASGCRVTVLSRRAAMAPENAEAIEGEREEALARLTGRRFDVVLDFICSKAEALDTIFTTIDPGLYVLISSTWVTRLNDATVPLLDITRSYLTGKASAEAIVARRRQAGERATVLRLPIMWGKGDRTGRFDFYRRRLTDGRALIAIDDAANRAQVAWSEDVARAMAAWVVTGECAERGLWEALPDTGTTVREIVTDIATAVGTKPRFVALSSGQLARELPAYLVEEPLWRETPLTITPDNLFTATGIAPTPRATWLRSLVQQPVPAGDKVLLETEAAYLKGMGHA
ncbi:MAG: NAD-dependent epimerase/dehydratase family protein [Rhodospirillales bacterium]|nr:NAD-dependent epimerase/dehydratase family protein [Rhodospirillales bacterium]